MFASLKPVIVLLLSFVILCLGHGLQSVLLPTRAVVENYSTIAMGVLMSSYYAGFITGTFTGPRLIAQVGHIRVFAASAAGACAVMLCFPMLPYPPLWFLLRFLYGLCLVHFYTVMESWLNSISGASNRGRILSVYMILNFIAMSGGQMLFSQTHADGMRMFSLSAMLLSLSLIPLLLSRTKRPAEVHSTETLTLKRLFVISPLGVAGAVTAGLAGGAYWGLTAPYILGMGFKQEHIAWFMTASLLGGLAAQWPLGVLSDHINRRWVILLAALILCVSAAALSGMTLVKNPELVWLLILAVMFGAAFHPLYSLCIAHTNDFVPQGQFVRASAGLQLVQSCGAVLGPLLAGALMKLGGGIMIYGGIAFLAGLLAAYSLFRIFENRIPRRFLPFRLVTRTGPEALFLDPRSKNDTMPIS
ncbi:MAG: MFS transporter [Alphaproteobacteria bacterium]|nr:MFS transporter [Alphaproteobacteria bacterium]